MESSNPLNINTGTYSNGKRTYQQFIKPEQIMHRFKAKSDFKKYFGEARKYDIHLVIMYSLIIFTAWHYVQ